MTTDRFKITKRAPGSVEIIQLHPDENDNSDDQHEAKVVSGLNEASIAGIALLFEGGDKGALQWL